LHSAKGLCFGDGSAVKDAILKSELVSKPQERRGYSTTPRPQSLWEHTEGVMKGVREKLLHDGDYRSCLVTVLRCLEPDKRPEDLANVIARLAILATGFHDLGKCGRR